ncbi:MAG: nicotinate-nucleotide adenylyltransferase [Clostridia bacterium]|nr:nicotinate-nucleotide adenylyltransferase [Clostridia bacterium]
MKVSKARIGIMGGTFNPIHEGHIHIARAAMRAAKLDQVLFLPDGQPPHKTGIAPAEDRWRMVCAAVAGEEGLVPNRMELDRTGTTYTFDTLTELQKAYPRAQLFYIIGTDTLLELKNWHRYEEVLKLCAFLVCPRSTKASPEEVLAERRRLTELGASLVSVDTEVVDISSTAIREAILSSSPTDLLSPVVQEYISLCGLYGGQPIDPRIQEWMTRLFADLNLKRFAHSIGVAYTARSLARNHGVDQVKAEVAALLHDCAKCMPLREMQQLALSKELVSDPELLSSNALLHAPVGAYIAETVYGLTDPEQLSAIANHTTGKPGMSKLDLIVYLADKIEPTRKDYPLLNKIRMMAPLSLERAAVMSMEGTESYVTKGGKPLHTQTRDTIQWLKQQLSPRAASNQKEELNGTSGTGQTDGTDAL